MDDGKGDEGAQAHAVDLDRGNGAVDIEIAADAVAELLPFDAVHVALVLELDGAGRDDLLNDVHRGAHVRVREGVHWDCLAADEADEDVAQAPAEALAGQGVYSALEGHGDCPGVDDDGQVESLGDVNVDGGILPGY